MPLLLLRLVRGLATLEKRMDHLGFLALDPLVLLDLLVHGGLGVTLTFHDRGNTIGFLVQPLALPLTHVLVTPDDMIAIGMGVLLLQALVELRLVVPSTVNGGRGNALDGIGLGLRDVKDVGALALLDVFASAIL